ncbi:hypothetical protein [Companilactobacillus farciminis]|uniref:hypothetical protein n=1 Tax=Companilactobacillus farciminis TaxID=1612 RepID=UPI001915C3A8|nr:hypothetical protein [Companilactobacillus farciminis]
MNKEKVMQILNFIDLGLNIIEEGQQLDTQTLTESVRTDIEDLKEELNSKPVMPKVFDEWCKDVIESYSGADTREALAIAFNTLLTVESSVYDESESNLKEWLVESDSIEGLDRISKCVDAILARRNNFE